jgi:hypothetical protein
MKDDSKTTDAEAAAHAEALLGEGRPEGETLPPEVLEQLMAAAKNAGAAPIPDPNAIIKPEMYSDLMGREVIHNVVVAGTVAEGFPAFVAQFVVPLKRIEQDPNTGKRQEITERRQMSAVIRGAVDLADAFAKFDAAAEAGAKQFIADLRSQHVRAQLAEGIQG